MTDDSLPPDLDIPETTLEAVRILRAFAKAPNDPARQQSAVAAMTALFGAEVGAVLVVTTPQGGGIAPNPPMRDAPSLFVALLCATQSIGHLLGLALQWAQQTQKKGHGIIVPGIVPPPGGNPRRGGPFG